MTVQNIFVVSADLDKRQWLTNFLAEAGYQVCALSNSSSFLRALKDEPNAVCAFVDEELEAGTKGISLLRSIDEIDIDIPIVLVAHNIDTDETIEAMRRGVVTVLTAPSTSASIANTIEIAADFRKVSNHRREVRDNYRRILRLSDRERMVLDLAVTGVPNKRIAAKLGVSMKTVERDRQMAYAKLGVRSTAEMTRVMVVGGLSDVVYPKIEMTGFESGPLTTPH